MTLFLALLISVVELVSSINEKLSVVYGEDCILSDIAEKLRLPEHHQNSSWFPLEVYLYRPSEASPPRSSNLAVRLMEASSCLHPSMNTVTLENTTAGLMHIDICHGSIIGNQIYGSCRQLGRRATLVKSNNRDFLQDLVLEARHSGRLAMSDALQTQPFITAADLIDGTVYIINSIARMGIESSVSGMAMESVSGCSIEQLQQEKGCRIYLESFSHEMRAIYTKVAAFTGAIIDTIGPALEPNCTDDCLYQTDSTIQSNCDNDSGSDYTTIHNSNEMVHRLPKNILPNLLGPFPRHTVEDVIDAYVQDIKHLLIDEEVSLIGAEDSYSKKDDDVFGETGLNLSMFQSVCESVCGYQKAGVLHLLSATYPSLEILYLSNKEQGHVMLDSKSSEYAFSNIETPNATLQQNHNTCEVQSYRCAHCDIVHIRHSSCTTTTSVEVPDVNGSNTPGTAASRRSNSGSTIWTEKIRPALNNDTSLVSLFSRATTCQTDSEPASPFTTTTESGSEPLAAAKRVRFVAIVPANYDIADIEDALCRPNGDDAINEYLAVNWEIVPVPVSRLQGMSALGITRFFRTHVRPLFITDNATGTSSTSSSRAFPPDNSRLSAVLVLADVFSDLDNPLAFLDAVRAGLMDEKTRLMIFTQKIRNALFVSDWSQNKQHCTNRGGRPELSMQEEGAQSVGDNKEDEEEIHVSEEERFLQFIFLQQQAVAATGYAAHARSGGGVYYSTSAFLRLAEKANLRIHNYDTQFCAARNITAPAYYSCNEDALIYEQVLRPLCTIGTGSEAPGVSGFSVIELRRRQSSVKGIHYSSSRDTVSRTPSCTNSYSYYGIACRGRYDDDFAFFAGNSRDEMAGWHDVSVMDAYEREEAVKSINTNEFIDHPTMRESAFSNKRRFDEPVSVEDLALYYSQLKTNIVVMRDWINRIIISHQEQGYFIIGVGSATKALPYLSLLSADLKFQNGGSKTRMSRRDSGTAGNSTFNMSYLIDFSLDGGAGAWSGGDISFGEGSSTIKTVSPTVFKRQIFTTLCDSRNITVDSARLLFMVFDWEEWDAQVSTDSMGGHDQLLLHRLVVDLGVDSALALLPFPKQRLVLINNRAKLRAKYLSRENTSASYVAFPHERIVLENPHSSYPVGTLPEYWRGSASGADQQQAEKPIWQPMLYPALPNLAAVATINKVSASVAGGGGGIVNHSSARPATSSAASSSETTEVLVAPDGEPQSVPTVVVDTPVAAVPSFAEITALEKRRRYDNFLPPQYIKFHLDRVIKAGRTPVILLSHFFNEHFLLPYWIQHNAPYFDAAVLIDYNSNDDSLDIIRKYAPRSWTVVPSQFDKITAHECDMELTAYENLFPGAWKIVLTTTEFVVHPNLRKYLSGAQARNVSVVRFPCMRINGDESGTLKRFDSLVKQRNHFAVSREVPSTNDWSGLNEYARFMHRLSGISYTRGRHNILYNGEKMTMELINSINIQMEWVQNGYLGKYKWSPWPQVIERKVQMMKKVDIVEIILENIPPDYHMTFEQQQHHRDEIDAKFYSFGLDDYFLGDIGKAWLETTGSEPKIDCIEDVTDLLWRTQYYRIMADDRSWNLSINIFDARRPYSTRLLSELEAFCIQAMQPEYHQYLNVCTSKIQSMLIAELHITKDYAWAPL